MRKPVVGGLQPTKAQTSLRIQTDQRLCFLIIRKYHIKACYKRNLFFKLVSVAEESGLSLALSNPKDRFCRVVAHMINVIEFGMFQRTVK